MSKSVDELKKIYLKEIEYMMTNYIDRFNNLATSFMNGNPDKQEFENLKTETQERLKSKYNLTEEDIETFHQHQDEWQKDAMPIVAKYLSS